MSVIYSTRQVHLFMSSLTSNHIDSILDISGLAGECVGESRFPFVLFQKMTDLFDSKSAVFYSMGDDLDNQPLWDGFGYMVDAYSVEQYEHHYRTVDPCYRRLQRRANSRQPLIVSTNEVIESEHCYTGSEYYQDFLKPQNIHSSIIFGVGDQQGMLGLFGFHRTPRMEHYSQQDHLKARLFASQIASSLRLRQVANDGMRLRAVTRKLMSHASIHHYLILDQNFRLIDSAGDAAKNLGVNTNNFILVDGDTNSVEHHLPKEIRQYVRKLLNPRMKNNNNDDLLRAFDNLHGLSRIRIDLLELDDQPPLVLLFFLEEDSGLISESRLVAFGLTPREQDIVHHVCRGLTTVQMAGQLGISAKTIENHLTHIYKKTQTRNRTELVRQLSI